MKILFVNPIIYTAETADIKRADSIRDTMSYDLCLAFRELGHDITLLAGGPFKPVQEEEYPFKVIWAKCALPKLAKPNALPYCPEIRRLVRDTDYDLIISSEVFSLNSLMLARRAKDRLIVWHELAKHNNLMKKLPSKLWYNLIARRFFRGVPVVARSVEAREFISRYCNNVSDKIIDHGVNLTKFEACTDKEDYFIVSSQLIPRKQIDKILTAFADFSAAHPSFRLYIFGEGECGQALKEQTASLQLEDRVRFFGKVPHTQLKDYLAKAAALLVYTRKDNNMISVVEAIACGTPTLTTSVPYNASYIRENGLGIVKDDWGSGDLEELLRRREELTANCLAYRRVISAQGKAQQFLDKKAGRSILLSSYSVNPYHGSEDGTGWNWTLQLSRHFNRPDDCIYLVTKKVNAADTAKGIAENGLTNVRLTVVDTPDWLNWYREHRSVFHHMYYILWQRCAYRWAKRSRIEFDVIHHATMGDFRIPGYMWKMKRPYTIFGPVGGGQSTPQALKGYEKIQAVEKFREIINRSRAVLPSYRKAVRHFDRVFAVNKETQDIMSRAMGRECERLIELAPEDRLKGLSIPERKPQEKVTLLYMGRLIHKKGIMLLLDVIDRMPQDAAFELNIYGGGPLEDAVGQYIAAHGLADKVTLCGTVEHDQVSAVYRSADIFIMPSLRETGGNVIVEAMAHKLPVMALEMSISRDLKENGCGLFVSIEQDRDGIIGEFAEKLTQLIASPTQRQTFGENGYRFVNESLSWDKKFETVYSDYEQN